MHHAIVYRISPAEAGQARQMDARTLLDIPNYNFDDQEIRPLAQPVALRPGDVLRVTCRHDASLRQMLPDLRTQPPRYVVWGDGTSDEMCLGLAIVGRP